MPRRADALPVAAVVGRNVHKLRTWRGLSLRDLDTRTGRAGHRVADRCLSQIERGCNQHGVPRMVTVDQLVVLARVLRVSPQQLMDPDYEPEALSRRSASARGTRTVPVAGQNRP